MEAHRLIREIIEYEARMAGSINLGRKLSITDDEGNVLLELPFSAVLQ